jgi:hypothetical protein
MARVTHPPKAYVSWSSGKDSAFALYEARRLGLAEIVGVLTTMNEVHQRVAMHAVRDALLDRQIAALGLPCFKVPLPSPCPNEVYEERLAAAIERIKSEGVRHVVFGDLFLEDVRAYREAQLARAGMAGIFPLWRRNTAGLAREMIASRRCGTRRSRRKGQRRPAARQAAPHRSAGRRSACRAGAGGRRSGARRARTRLWIAAHRARIRPPGVAAGPSRYHLGASASG